MDSGNGQRVTIGRKDNIGQVAAEGIVRHHMISLVVLRGWSVRKGTAENILRVPIGCHALLADEENGCNAPAL